MKTPPILAVASGNSRLKIWALTAFIFLNISVPKHTFDKDFLGAVSLSKRSFVCRNMHLARLCRNPRVPGPCAGAIQTNVRRVEQNTPSPYKAVPGAGSRCVCG